MVIYQVSSTILITNPLGLWILAIHAPNAKFHYIFPDFMSLVMFNHTVNFVLIPVYQKSAVPVNFNIPVIFSSRLTKIHSFREIFICLCFYNVSLVFFKQAPMYNELIFPLSITLS